MNEMTTPRACALTDVSFNKFRHQAEEPGICGTMMSLPKLMHDGIEVCHASYPSASGRVEGCHDEPSHNYKMAAKSAIMMHYPRAAACLYQEAKEFKESSSSRRAQHDPLL